MPLKSRVRPILVACSAALAGAVDVPTVAAAGACPTSTATEPSKGDALERLPRDCDVTAYVDVAGIAGVESSADASNRLRDRAGEALEAVAKERYARATRAAADVMKALGSSGIGWKHVFEVGLCGGRDDAKMVTIEGNFHGRDAASALLATPKKSAPAPIASVTKDGKRLVTITEGSTPYYVVELEPGLLAIAPDSDTIRTALATPASSTRRLAAARSLADVKSRDAKGRTVETTLASISESSQALTVVVTNAKGLAPTAERAELERMRADWSRRLRETPLATLGDAIARGEVLATKDEASLHVELPRGDLDSALAKAETASGDRFAALLHPPTSMPTAVGGGPPAAEPSQRAPKR